MVRVLIGKFGQDLNDALRSRFWRVWREAVIEANWNWISFNIIQLQFITDRCDALTVFAHA
jgi:hypothetical protein